MNQRLVVADDVASIGSVVVGSGVGAAVGIGVGADVGAAVGVGLSVAVVVGLDVVVGAVVGLLVGADVAAGAAVEVVWADVCAVVDVGVDTVAVDSCDVSGKVCVIVVGSGVDAKVVAKGVVFPANSPDSARDKISTASTDAVLRKITKVRFFKMNLFSRYQSSSSSSSSSSSRS